MTDKPTQDQTEVNLESLKQNITEAVERNQQLHKEMDALIDDFNWNQSIKKVDKQLALIHNKLDEIVHHNEKTMGVLVKICITLPPKYLKEGVDGNQLKEPLKQESLKNINKSLDVSLQHVKMLQQGKCTCDKEALDFRAMRLANLKSHNGLVLETRNDEMDQAFQKIELLYRKLNRGLWGRMTNTDSGDKVSQEMKEARKAFYAEDDGENAPLNPKQ